MQMDTSGPNLALPLGYEVQQLSEGFSAVVYDANGTRIADHLYESQAADIVRAVNAYPALVEALEGAKAAMAGYLDDHSHFAPDDCYATGPKTGDPAYDLVRCPGCTAENGMRGALKKIDAALALSARGDGS